MSKTIDERVVSMEFDNSRFEKNVATSMSTLEKLKNSLNLNGVAEAATKGLAGIATASKGFNFSPLENGVESVKLKFSALQIAGVTALANITNSAVNTGKQLVKSLSVDQIAAGWDKFGSKTTSVATLVAQGNDLDTVNEQLDKLNWFTDETSYNFTDMVSNIAKFTAAGKGLDESVTAMEGIANWAALSGQNAQTASRAMYQISQAMGAGVMRLEDYKSIQNASMDTDEFRQQCLDAAVALGTLEKTADGTYKSLVGGGEAFSKSQFTTQLTEGAWLTSDVMMDVFNNYSEAVNAIYKVTEEKGMLASEVLDQIHDRADELKTDGMSDTDAINAAIKDLGYTLEDGSLMFDAFGVKAFEAAQKARTWGDAVDSVKDAVSTGWMNTFEIIFGNADEATELWTDLANAMYDVFAGGAEARNEMLKGWKELGGRDALIESFWNAWGGIASIITPIKEAFRDIFPPMTAERLFEITEKVRDLTARFKELAEKYAPQIKKVFTGLFSALSAVFKIAGSVVKVIWNIGKSFTPVLSGIISIVSALGEFISKLTSSVQFTTVFNGALSGVSKALSFIGGLIGKVASIISKAINGLNYGTFVEFVSSIGEKIGSAVDTVAEKIGGVFGNVIKKFKNFLSNLDMSSFLGFMSKVGSAIKTVGITIGKLFSKLADSKVRDTIKDILNEGLLVSFVLKVNTVLKSLSDLLSGKGGGLSGGFKTFFEGIKSLFTGSGLTGVLGSVKTFFDGFKSMLVDFGKGYKLEKVADLLWTLAKAIGVLTVSLLVLSGIEPTQMATAVGAITAVIAELVGSVAILSTIKSAMKNASSIGKLMISMSVAILILAAALKKLSDLKWDEIGRGLTGILGLMAILTVAMIALSKFVGASESAFSISKKGIFSSKSKNQFVSMGIAFIAIAAAMKILASAAKDFGSMDWGSLAKAGAAIAGILALFVSFQALMKVVKPEKMISSATSLVIIGAAMEIFANVCKKFGSMDWGSLAKAGAAIAGILVLAAGFALLSGLSKKMMKSSIALVIIGAAMEIFANVCKKFGSMDWGSLAKAGAAIAGILVLAAGFVLLSGLSKKMIKSVIALTIIASAMKTFASICQVFGSMEWESLGKAGAAIAGILVLAAGFALLSGLSTGIMSSSVALLIMAAALNSIVPVLTTLGAMSWGSIAKGLVALGGAFAIIGLAGALLGPVVPVILSLSGALALLGIACLAIGAGVLAFSAGLAILSTVTVGAATSIVAAVSIIVTGILELIPAISDSLVKAIESICGVIMQTTSTVAETIKTWLLTVIGVVTECVPALAEGALKLILELMTLLTEYAPQIVDGLLTLFVKFMTCAAERAPEFIEALLTFILAVVNGIADHMDEIVEAGVRIVSSIINGIANSLGPIVQNILVPILGILKDVIVGIAEAIAPYIPVICDCFTQLTQIVSDAIVKIVEALAPFMPNIQAIVESITTAVVAICGAFTSLFEQLSPIINSITGLVQSLGNVISEILNGIAEVISSVGGAISAVFESIADIISSCGEVIAASLEGISSTIETTFSGIAEVITAVGSSIQAVLDAIAGIISSIGEAALNAGTGFENLANGVKTITELNLLDMAASMGEVAIGIGKIASHADGLSAAGEGMKQIANGTNMSASAFAAISNGVSSIISSLSSIGQIANTSMLSLVSSMTSAKVAVTGLASSFSSAGTAITTGLVRGIQAAGANVRSVMVNLLTSLISIIRGKAGQFSAAGKTLVTMFANGVKSKLSSITSAFSSSLSSVVAAISSKYQSFYQAGTYLGSGLVLGINSKQQAAYDAGYALGQKAVQGEKDGQQSKSPSKLTMKAGKWIGEGLIIGMQKMAKSVYNSGHDLGEGAVNSISSVISEVSDLINSDVDAQPTIRPVVDLSDVQTGADAINGLLSSAQTVGVQANLNAVGSTMNAIRQNGKNDDVILAINKLRDKLDGVGNTYNTVNGVTYDDGSNVTDAVETLVRYAKIGRRV